MSQAAPTAPAFNHDTPYLNLVGTLLVPYVIFYLAHFPNTRFLREAILPLAYIAAVRLVLLTRWNIRGEYADVN